jgi:hypothetical protein
MILIHPHTIQRTHTPYTHTPRTHISPYDTFPTTLHHLPPHSVFHTHHFILYASLHSIRISSDVPGHGRHAELAGPLRRARGGDACRYSVMRIYGTVHRTPYTVHRTPYTVHHTPYAIHRAPYTVHRTPCTVHYTPYTVHYTPYTIHHTPYTVHHTPYTVHHTPYYTMYHALSICGTLHACTHNMRYSTRMHSQYVDSTRMQCTRRASSPSR